MSKKHLSMQQIVLTAVAVACFENAGDYCFFFVSLFCLSLPFGENYGTSWKIVKHNICVLCIRHNENKIQRRLLHISKLLRPSLSVKVDFPISTRLRQY